MCKSPVESISQPVAPDDTAEKQRVEREFCRKNAPAHLVGQDLQQQLRAQNPDQAAGRYPRSKPPNKITGSEISVAEIKKPTKAQT